MNAVKEGAQQNLKEFIAGTLNKKLPCYAFEWRTVEGRRRNHSQSLGSKAVSYKMQD